MEDVKIVEEFLRPRPTGYGSAYGDGYGYGSGDGYGSVYGSGYGYGSGDGYGSVYGSGSGSGYGYGSGYGSAYGSGDGYGSVYGYGSGDGYGYGSGYGSGDGYGYGSGSGDDIKTYNGQKVYYIDDVPTLIDAVHGDTARGSIVQRDLTLKPCFIARSGNSFAHGDTLHDAMNDAQQKELEDSPLEERIARFVEDHPDPDALHPCKELHSWHHTLTGSCKMGRDQFVKEHGLDMEADYSVRYFIEITATAYGGKAIRQLAQAYGSTLVL